MRFEILSVCLQMLLIVLTYNLHSRKESIFMKDLAKSDPVKAVSFLGFFSGGA